MQKIKIILAAIALLAATSCASKDYIYYKSKCACGEITNYANIRNA
jgi:hypothetical protein